MWQAIPDETLIRQWEREPMECVVYAPAHSSAAYDQSNSLGRAVGTEEGNGLKPLARDTWSTTIAATWVRSRTR
jgi:hypothetical protein